MPSRNTRKPSPAVDSTFHLYNRGIDGQKIFKDDHDRREFLQCFRRHLSPGHFSDSRGRAYRKLTSQVEALAYCLMPNHFHFVLHQIEDKAMARLIESAITGYVMYFNNRYGRSGPLFASPYRAAPKTDIFEIQTAIAYVHSNHSDGLDYKFCSHPAYVGNVEPPDWVNVDAGLAVFGGKARYSEFLNEYESRR